MNATRFAELLTEGVHRIRLREGKAIAIVQDELGYALGRQGGASVEFWRKGNIPPRMQDVEELGCMLAMRARLDTRWLEAFLRSGGHPAAAAFSESFFAVDGQQQAVPDRASAQADHAQAKPAEKPPAPLKLPLSRLPVPGELPPASVMPYGRNPLFVGRAAELQAIAKLLESGRGETPAVIATVAVTGIGGVGKTQIASEFVYCYGRWFKGGVFWINCDNEAQMIESIAACGHTGALDIGGDFASHSTQEQAAMVLAKWHGSTHRLLIFNNCEDPALLRKWRPRSGGGRVLITERRSEWEPVLGVQTHRAGVLARAESIALLRSYGNDHADVGLDAVAHDLGDLPLALHLAGSYLYRFRSVLTPARYLELLREQEYILHASLQSAPLTATDRHWNLQSAFALSASQLNPARAIDAVALEILRILAVLAPDDLLERSCLLLCLRIVASGKAAELDARMDDVLRVEEALARLQELGLATLEDAAGSAGRDETGSYTDNARDAGTYAMHTHRLIGSFTRATEPEAVQVERTQVEEVMVEELQRSDAEGAPLLLRPWRGHLHYAVTAAMRRADALSGELGYWFGRFAFQKGDYTVAEKILEESLAVRSVLFGRHSLEAAQARSSLAHVQARVFKLFAARDNLAEVLHVRTELLGNDDIEVADALADIAGIDAAERLMSDAIVRLERAYAICEKAGGENSLVMAQVASDLALLLVKDAAQRERVLILLESAWRIRRGQLGANHIHTTMTHASLGYALQHMGEHARAMHTYQEVLAMRIAGQGEDHWGVGHVRFLIGSLASQQGNWQEAHDQLHIAIGIAERTSEADDALINACQNEMGLVLLADGRGTDAIQRLHRVVLGRESIYRQAHPDLLDSLLRLVLAAVIAGDEGLTGAALGRAAELAEVLEESVLVRYSQIASRLERLAASRLAAPNITGAIEHGSQQLRLLMGFAAGLPVGLPPSIPNTPQAARASS